MQKPLLTLIASTFFLFANSYPLLALENDFRQEIKIDSDLNSFDGIRKMALYKGNVKVTQGTLTITADEMHINAEQGQGKEIFIAVGKPAIYQQTMEDGSIAIAQAEKLEYRRENHTLIITGDASLEQNNHSVSGESIQFNLEKEQVLAQASEDGTDRVTTIFQPKPEAPKTRDTQPEKDNDEGGN